MAVGKNKGLSKGSKKKSKRTVDPFTRKEWYDVVAPGVVKSRNICKTLVTKYTGMRSATENLRHRVFETYIADINDTDPGSRKIKFIVEDIQGKNCLTNFHSLSLTRDKLCSMVKKWQTLIEGFTKAKTTDGYEIRMFCIGFTKRQQNQVKKTTYAKSQKIKKIRRKMVEIMSKEISTNCLKDLLSKKIIPDMIVKDITSQCLSIFPLHDVHIRKIKVTKRPNFDAAKLAELHSEANTESGTKMEGATTAGGSSEPPIMESV